MIRKRGWKSELIETLPNGTKRYRTVRANAELNTLEKLAKIKGLLEVIDDALQQILEAQFGFTDKEWLDAIQRLEYGHSATLGYVTRKVEAIEHGR